MLNLTGLQNSIQLLSEISNLNDNIFVFLETYKSILSLHGLALNETCDVVEVPKTVFLGRKNATSQFGLNLYSVDMLSFISICILIRLTHNVGIKIVDLGQNATILPMLWYHQLDLYIFPEGVQNVRYPLLTFQTNSYDLFVSKPAYSFNGSFFVTAFSKSLWVAWIGAFGVSFVALYIGSYFFKHEISFLHMVYNQAGAGTGLIRKLHQAVLVLVVSCQGIFFWTAISTFLTAERASTGQPFQNLNDLRISGEFSICVRENTPEYDFFQRSDLAALINRDAEGCPTEWDDRGKLIDQVCAAKRKIAFVEKSTLLHEFQMLKGRDFPCRVKRMFSQVYQNRRYFVARPGFGFVRRFNEVILKLKSHGLLKKVNNMFGKTLTLQFDHIELDISFESMGALFWFYLIFVAVSAVLLALEKICM